MMRDIFFTTAAELFRCNYENEIKPRRMKSVHAGTWTPSRFHTSMVLYAIQQFNDSGSRDFNTTICGNVVRWSQ
jgi:hypothetical protein